jgi:hypothetical protein
MAYGIKKLTVEFNFSRLTHFGGVYLFHLFLKQVGLRRLFAQKTDFPQRNNHYTVSEMIFSLMYPVILGIGRIEITSLLGNNGVFKLLTGLKSYPNPTTLRRFLLRGTEKLLPQLIRLHDRLRKYFIDLIVPEKKLLIDLDSTVCTIFGHQEGAVKGYNPTHRGKRSYHPLFGFENKSGSSLFGLLRKGSAYTSDGTVEYLKSFFEQYPKEEYRIRFRGDSGFYNKEIIALIGENNGEFAIVADMTGPLKRLVNGLEYQTKDNVYSFSETKYQPTNWKKEFRYCIIRRKLEKEETDQATMFTINAYSYSAIVTNMAMTPFNVWKHYSERALCERNIRSLKEDYYLGNIPTKHFSANEQYLEILLWAYDLVKWFQRLCLPKDWQSKTLQTLRNELLLLPGSFVRHGNKQILRFPKNSPYQKVFLSAKERIEKLKDLNMIFKKSKNILKR